MIRAFRAEWLKTTRRPATWIVAASLLGILVLFVYLPGWWFFSHAPAGQLPTGFDVRQARAEFYPPLLIPHFLAGMVGVGGAASLVLGVLSLGSDYAWGSMHTITALPPSRTAALAGRLGALALLLLLLTLMLWVCGAGLSWLLASIDAQPVRWPRPDALIAAVASTWLIFAMWCGLGLLLASAFRQPIVPIAAGLIYMLVIEGLVLNVLGGVGFDVVHDVERLLPGPNAGALTQAFGHGYVPAGIAVPSPLAGAVQATAVVLAYVVAFCAGTAYFVARRDVT
jgi:ABC-2 type transport system permease protein